MNIPSDRRSPGGYRGSPYKPTRSSPRIPTTEPTIRALTNYESEADGLLPPPIPHAHHNRSSESISSVGSGPSRRICAKCGEPMTDKFVRAMGKKFHLDCFRCHVVLAWCVINNRSAM